MKDTITADAGRAGVLARKLAVARDGGGAVANSMVLKALRRSLARAAKELCDLPLAVLAARQANLRPEDLGKHLSDEQLLMVLDGPDGRLGAVTMDAATVTALIQRQTIGVVMGMVGSQRNYTSTDAAMCSDFIENSIGKVTEMLDGHSDRLSFEGYRFGARIADVRSLLLALEADTYRTFDLTLDLDAGKLQGRMGLILPDPSTFETKGDGDDGLFNLSLGSNMGVMRAEMSAVLCRFRLPVSEFTALKKGDVVPLDSAFLYETELVGINGQVIASGRLGQLNGSRAIRLSQGSGAAEHDEAPAFASGMTGGGLPAPEPMAAEPLGLEVAANTLQDPMGGLPMDGMPMDDLPMGGLDDLPGGDFAAEGDNGELPGTGPGDLSGFDPDDALAEISDLAGLEGFDPPS